MLDLISYLLPSSQLLPLIALLREANDAQITKTGVLLASAYPAQAYPKTAIVSSEVAYPVVHFAGDQPIDVHLGDLQLTSERDPKSSPSVQSIMSLSLDHHITAETLYERFSGVVARVDHTGIEIPSAMMSATAWDMLQKSIGQMCNLYSYPTGEQWPFIVPSTRDEFDGEVRQFDAPRTPKFELTYGYVDEPLLQFHIDTILSRSEVEARLPEGFKLGGVVESFRSVFIAHPWANLKIRCDLTFDPEGVLAEWDSGEWLVTEGRRIR